MSIRDRRLEAWLAVDPTILDDPLPWGGAELDTHINLDDLGRRHDGLFDREREES